MLHELLACLLGFTGDILIEDNINNTIRVRDGFDLLSKAELEQANRIAPLGWYYLRLRAFVSKHDIRWGCISAYDNNQGFKAYKTAMSAGIEDLLEVYMYDIAFIEQTILIEGPIPLSKLLQYVLKYTIILPVIYKICMDCDKDSINGCQVLDYLTNYRSGVPGVNTVVER
jgi:hypothetical protein